MTRPSDSTRAAPSVRPSSGRIQIGGTALHREHLREIRRQVGLVFQDPDDQLFMPTVEASR